MAKHRQQLYKTGGGSSSCPDFTEIEKVMAICSNITGLDARNDSDNIPEPILKETAKDIVEELPLQTSNNNIIMGSCNDDVPVTILEKDDFCLRVQKENISSEENDEAPFLATYQPMQEQDIEGKNTQKENNWSSWNPKALKTKINPMIKAHEAHKSTKAGVTAKLDQLTKGRLELVALQKEIALKEHEFKMLCMEKDEQRKQEIHELLVRQLSHGVHKPNILDINK